MFGQSVSSHFIRYSCTVFVTFNVFIPSLVVMTPRGKRVVRQLNR